MGREEQLEVGERSIERGHGELEEEGEEAEEQVELSRRDEDQWEKGQG